MKQKILILFLLATEQTSFNLSTKNFASHLSEHKHNHSHKLSSSKFSFFTGFLLLYIGYHQSNIIESCKNHPISTAILSLVTTNYIFDSYLKHQQVKNLMSLFAQFQLMTRYILSAITIKNLMLEKYPYSKFDDEYFQSKSKAHLNIDFNDLEILVYENLNNASLSLKELNIKVHAQNKEQMYFLVRNEINFEQLLLLIKDDTELVSHIQRFYLNPPERYQKTLLYLHGLIKKNLSTIFTLTHT